MDIVVRQSGGVLGVEKKIELRGGALTVTDSGASRREPLQPAKRASLQAQAEVLLDQVPHIKRRKGSPVSDVLETEVLIDDGAGNSRRIHYQSGDSVPSDFRQFVSSVVELAPDR